MVKSPYAFVYYLNKNFFTAMFHFLTNYNIHHKRLEYICLAIDHIVIIILHILAVDSYTVLEKICIGIYYETLSIN